MKMKEFFSGPEKWCKKHAAIDKDGNPILTFDGTTAVKCCLFGALEYCYHEDGESKINEIERLIMQQHYSYIVWNDAPERTFEDVKELVERLDI